MLFENAPSRLPVHPWVANDLRAKCSDWANSTLCSQLYPGQVSPIELAGYTVRDIFFLELCVRSGGDANEVRSSRLERLSVD